MISNNGLAFTERSQPKGITQKKKECKLRKGVNWQLLEQKKKA
jgi:hypothetical protein